MTADLVEWLRAQLDEDERVAKAAVDAVADHGGSQVWPDVRAYTDEEGDALDTFAGAVTPARVLRDVEAKRHLVEQADLRGRAIRTATLDGGFFDHILRVLALPYSDRPGYRAEWRP